MYPTANELVQLWNDFESVKNIVEHDYGQFPDVKKLMTATSVIDLSAHEIYPIAASVHELSAKLLKLKIDHPGDQAIDACCQRWTNILKKRNQIPLILKHHQRLDGECDFRFSLQLMEGKPCGFKEIQVLHHQKDAALDEAVKSMVRLGHMAHGHSFGNLPLMKNTVFTSLMESQDVLCLVAKDQSDQIIGYSWGLMLRDVEVGKKQKTNVFWIMDLARDADFHDEHTKVGEQLRARMVEELKSRKDCDFVGYQHILNHKFHMGIVNNAQNEDEQLHLDNAEHAAQPAKSTVIYSEDLNLHVRVHFIKANEKDIPYPEHKNLKPAIVEAFWRASHSAKDFLVGALAFMGKQKYQQLTHKLLDQPVEQRIVAPVSAEQQICDAGILKQIILSDKWTQEGTALFAPNHIPTTVGKLQQLAKGDALDFQAIKSCVANRGKSATRKVNANLLYGAIAVADSPTFALNTLLNNHATPKDWVELITNNRNSAINTQRERNVANIN